MVTRRRFARKLLDRLGASHDQRTKEGKRNMRALVAWMQAEGSEAKFNPLATTMPWAGATDFNSVGVKNYRDFDDGLEATLKTILLRNPEFGYAAIVSSLRAGERAEETLEAVEDSQWGTGGLALKVLAGWIHHPERFTASAETPIGQ